MLKLKVAVLEDNKVLLKDIVSSLKEIGLVDVVAYSDNSEDFIKKVDKFQVDALILDIELNNESISGIDIANKLKLPVLFTSGKTKKYLSEIESIQLGQSTPVMYIMKPISLEKLENILQKLITQVANYQKSICVTLKFKEVGKKEVLINEIVYVETIGVGTNNKRFHFKNRKPETMIRTSFSDLESKGLHKEKFVKTAESHLVNKEHVIDRQEGHKLKVKAMNADGNQEDAFIPVSENNRSKIKRMFR